MSIAPQAQRSRLKNRAVVMYLILAVGLAWLIWGSAWVVGAFDAGPTSVNAQVLLAIGAFAPALAAFLVRQFIERQGFADAGLRPNFVRGWPYYLFGWLLPLPVVATVVGLARVFGIPFAHTELQPTIVINALIGAVILAPITFGEEFGWRGYLQIRWFRKQPLVAAVMTGLVWGVFHYPIILLGFEGYENALLGLIVFPVFTVLLSIIFAWLRERTGSIWSVCLAHGAANATGGSLTALLFYGNGQWLLTSYAGVLAWIPLGAVCAWIVLVDSRRRRSVESSVLEVAAP